jgi:hypothetical protein
VSIIVPLRRDEKLFEETLLSILENQVDGCEVIAVHNGTYSDPFDLGDEVRFVVARSSNLVDLIRDAFPAAHGSVVHVLGTGLRATADWTTAAIDMFSDNNVAAAIPALVDRGGVSSGWCDTTGRLCNPVRLDSAAPRPGQLRGFFLDAFFARRRVLGNLLDAVAPAMNDPVAVAYAFGCLLQRAGWLISDCRDSLVDASQEIDAADQSDRQRGECLAAIRSWVVQHPAPLPTLAMLKSALFGPSSLGEMVGTMQYRGTLPAIRRAVDPQSVIRADAMSRLASIPAMDSQRRAA